jgi:hypothetical protein
VLKLDTDDDKEQPTTIVDISGSISVSKPYRTTNKRSLKQLKSNKSMDDVICKIHTALDTEGFVDLTVRSEVRKRQRKDFGNRPTHLRHVDPVYVVELHIVCDYNKYFLICIDPDITLNIKGPLANLWYGFKRIYEAKENRADTIRVLNIYSDYFTFSLI